MTRTIPCVAFAAGLVALLSAGCPADVEYVEVIPAQCETRPTFLLLLPSPDGTTEITSDDLQLHVDVGIFNLVDKLGQAPEPCEGHFHVAINGEFLQMVTTDRETLDVHFLEDGVHTISVTVHNNDHSRIEAIDALTASFTKDIETN